MTSTCRKRVPSTALRQRKKSKDNPSQWRCTEGKHSFLFGNCTKRQAGSSSGAKHNTYRGPMGSCCFFVVVVILHVVHGLDMYGELNIPKI